MQLVLGEEKRQNFINTLLFLLKVLLRFKYLFFAPFHFFLWAIKLECVNLFISLMYKFIAHPFDYGFTFRAR